MKTLKIKINTHGNPMPEVHGDWIDLFTAEDTQILGGETALISLGVSMQLPEGYYAIVAPRSSTCGRWNIIMSNSIGIIDSDYCGNDDIWHFPAYAIKNTFIPKGKRIAQFTLMKKKETPIFEQTDCLLNKNRGGLGSSGE